MKEFYQIVKMVKETKTDYAIPERIKQPTDAAKFIKSKISDLAYEVFGAVYLNAKNRPLGWSIIAQGSGCQCAITPKELYTQALLTGAQNIIVFHNHPSGDPEPSKDDKEITDILRDAGKIMSVKMLDHIIIGDGFHSMAKYW